MKEEELDRRVREADPVDEAELAGWAATSEGKNIFERIVVSTTARRRTELSTGDLEKEAAEELPLREAMTVIDPGPLDVPDAPIPDEPEPPEQE